MAITTNGELLTALASWSRRSDLTSVLPDFVMLAESIFNFGEGKPDDPNYISPLRTRAMETNATVTISSGSGSLPTDYLAFIDGYTATRNLTYVPYVWYTENFPTGQSTDPSFYSILGSSAYCGANFTLKYYAKIGALATSLNWLLTASPGAYLHGALYQLYLYMKNAERAALHRGLMVGAIAGLQGADTFSRSNAPQRRASSVAW